MESISVDAYKRHVVFRARRHTGVEIGEARSIVDRSYEFRGHL